MKKPTKTAKKPSILSFGQVMDAVDNRDLYYYNNMTEEEKTEFKKKSFVFLRAASCVSDSSKYAGDYILAVNAIANYNWFDFSKHPELQWKLLALTGCGYKVRHNWIEMSKKGSRNGFIKILTDKYPELSDEEIEILDSKMSFDDKKYFLEGMGWDDEQISAILK